MEPAQPFSHLAEWLDTTAGIITTTTVVVTALTWVVKRGLRVYKWISHIYDELTPNGGGSIKDAIQRIDALLMASMNLSGKAFWLSDPEGNCTFASLRLAQLMGGHPSQILGMGWVSFIDPADREECRKEWDAAVKDSRDFNYRVNYVTSTNKLVPVKIQAVPVKHAQSGKIVGMIGWSEPLQPNDNTPRPVIMNSP